MREFPEDYFLRLPVLKRCDGLGLRWLGHVVESPHAPWVGDLSNAAWGYLQDCGWLSILQAGGPMRNADGNIRTTWRKALARAARRLAEEGERAGPSGDPEVWASWIAFEMSEPHRWIREAT